MSTLATGVLPVARYRFRARVLEPLRLPEYPGSLLRGQFGAGLRQLACMTRQADCDGCPLLPSCPYTRIFTAPAPAAHSLQRFSAIPNPYVVEPPPIQFDTDGRSAHRTHYEQDEVCDFDMVLTGHALEQLPLVIVAWQRALARGLSKSRSRLELESVSWQQENGQQLVVWEKDLPRIEEHNPELSIPPCPDNSAVLHLDFHTPLRLQHQGRPLGPELLQVRALISNLVRRCALLLEFHAQQPQWGSAARTTIDLSSSIADQRRLRWFDWRRYSSRQGREMHLGGVLGRWTLDLPPSIAQQLWPWLYLGQWLHVGKNATFGMGGYRLSTG